MTNSLKFHTAHAIASNLSAEGMPYAVAFAQALRLMKQAASADDFIDCADLDAEGNTAETGYNGLLLEEAVMSSM